MATRIPAWAKAVGAALAASTGIAAGILAFGKSSGAAEATVSGYGEAIRDHETRIRAVEDKATETHTDVKWIKDALILGRDPITGKPLGR